MHPVEALVSDRRPQMMSQVLDAISSIQDDRDPTGSTENDIVYHLRQQPGMSSRRNLIMQIRKALKHALEAGIVAVRSGRYRVLVQPTSGEDGRDVTPQPEPPAKPRPQRPHARRGRPRRDGRDESGDSTTSASSVESAKVTSARRGTKRGKPRSDSSTQDSMSTYSSDSDDSDAPPKKKQRKGKEPRANTFPEDGKKRMARTRKPAGVRFRQTRRATKQRRRFDRRGTPIPQKMCRPDEDPEEDKDARGSVGPSASAEMNDASHESLNSNFP